MHDAVIFVAYAIDTITYAVSFSIRSCVTPPGTFRKGTSYFVIYCVPPVHVRFFIFLGSVGAAQSASGARGTHTEFCTINASVPTSAQPPPSAAAMYAGVAAPVAPEITGNSQWLDSRGVGRSVD